MTTVVMFAMGAIAAFMFVVVWEIACRRTTLKRGWVLGDLALPFVAATIVLMWAWWPFLSWMTIPVIGLLGVVTAVFAWRRSA